MSGEEYIEQMTLNQELFAGRVEDTVISDAEREAFAGEGGELFLLAITEDFCGDSAQFLPPLIRLAREVEGVEVRFLLRDGHRELAEHYRRRDGYQAIPVIIALDADGNERGFLIERPQRVYDAMAQETIRFARENPELDGVNRSYDRMPDKTKQAVRQNIEAFRGARQREWTRWLFEDLARLVSAPSAASTAL
jgi:hypothetical protein